MFLTVQELTTHLYSEQIEAIGGDDDTLLTAAIDGAIAEAKGYLAAFDRDAVFAASGSSRHALLLIFCKDIAVWHYINLANPGTDLKFRQDRYNAAIAWLKGVQKGDISPDLPPLASTDDVINETVIWGSNSPRNNHI